MIDILQTAINGDLLIKNGDFVLGESNTQNVYDIINSVAGEWKQFPNNGVGIIYYLNSNMDPYSITQKVKTQLKNDGFNTDNLKMTFDSSNSTEKIDVSGVTRDNN